jgi:hypothetical protein
LRNAVFYAFNQWRSRSPLSFKEYPSNSDIMIKWGIREHGDGIPFDGPGNVLAHALCPLGDIHFDDDEGWTDTPSIFIPGVDVASVDYRPFYR